MGVATTPRELVASRRVVVCVGTGGVGKTTISASLALGAARLGRRALVLTIDPARRLADALGVEELGNHPRAIPREILSRLGVPPEGELSAMMLDMKSTFDDLVQRFAADDDSRERILQNPIYQHVSDALAGSAEYSAMEKVFEISESKDFDLIVLDTPPSQHALDFLEAPERLLEFLDSRLVQLLLHPAMAAGRVGFRLFQRGTQRILRILEKVSGMAFLEDISEFLLAFEGMSEGFRDRATRVRSLLYGPESAFVLAAGPAGQSIAHATSFLDRLSTSPVRVAGVVLNRVRVWPGGAEPPAPGDRSAAIESLTEAFRNHEGADFPAREGAEAAVAAVDGYASVVERDATASAPLLARARNAGYFWRVVPELRSDVHDLEGLAQVTSFVFESEPSVETTGKAEREREQTGGA